VISIATCRPLRRDLPDGQISRDPLLQPVQPHFQKYFAMPVGQIISTSSPRPAPQRGARAIVTDAGRDAVDAAALTTNGTEADGQVVWS
jgi:hypothetical protein